MTADEKNRDLIIFGQADKTSPPLYLEDFVVALKSVWRKYARLEGNVYYYSNPGCSIDPTPEVMRELQMVQRRFSASDQGFDQEWRRVCQKPQKVRVLGVPFNTRFARVLVDADYDMKTLADSTDKLDLPGFTGIMDMTIRLARAGGGRNQASPSLNRFWFYPGETLYEESAGVIAIKQCYVRLLTEQMYTNAKGQMKGSGGAETLAKTFADNFTALYSKVARERAIYRELESLFRFVALAQAIKSKYPDAVSQFSLDYLLDRFEVEEASVPQWVPGRDAVEEFSQRRELSGGYSTSFQRFSICGGVDIAIEAEERNFIPVSGERLARLKSDIETARPATGNTFVWDIPNQAGYLDRYNLDARIQETNRLNKLVLTFSIVDAKPDYELTDGKTSKRYSLKQLPDMTREINEHFTSTQAKIGYVELQGFDNQAQVNAMASTFNIQMLRLLQRRKGDNDLPELVLSESAKVENAPPAKEAVTVTEETTGPYKGFFKATAEVIVKWKDGARLSSKKLFVTAYGKTREIVQAFIHYFLSILFNANATDFHVITPAEAKARAIQMMKADFPDADRNGLHVEITDEAGSLLIVNNLASRTVETEE